MTPLLTDCKDNGIIDLATYVEILGQFPEEDMERIKYYMERLEGHHNDTSKFMDGIKEEWDVT